MIYLDNAGTTAVRPEVLAAMMPFLSENFSNPSSIYKGAGQAKAAMDAARGQVAMAIGAAPSEIFFTGSGTEAINWALKGIMFNHAPKVHMITTAVEHHASLYTAQSFEKFGFEVTYLPVDEFGMVTVEQVAEAMQENTVLVSIMMANNEMGSIMPIAEIGTYLKTLGRKIHFFTDAVQALGQEAIDVKGLGVDLLAVSGHKIGAAKGVGALYVKGGTKLLPLLHGGGQERGRRGGTENVAGIVGLGLAAELAVAEMLETTARHREMRDGLIKQILDKIPHARLNGHPVKRLANNVNISFEFIEGESILLLLDNKGIWASSGSACTSGALDPSHVLLAMGLPHEMAHGSLRLTLGKDSNLEELDKLMEVLPDVVQKLRDMSPLWPS